MCADVLGKFFQKWQIIFPNHPTGKTALAIYLEALSDFSPTEIELACQEATRTAEQFPKPGHIRNALAKVQSAEPLRRSRPAYLDAAVVPINWTDEDQKASNALIAKLGPVKKKVLQRAVLPTLRRGFKSIEQQKAELKEKGYL